MKKIAIFDFCDTLIKMQTANVFLEYILYNKLRFQPLINDCARRVLRKIGKLHGFNHKAFHAKQLRGMDTVSFDSLVKKFYEEVLVKNENGRVKEKLLWHQQNNFITCIISGGFSDYLEYYAKENNINFVIGVKLERINNKLTGKIINGDTLGFQKASKLKSQILLEEYDLKSSYCYSDHISDEPLFSLVGNPVAVVRNETEGWAKKKGYSLICSE